MSIISKFKRSPTRQLSKIISNIQDKKVDFCENTTHDKKVDFCENTTTPNANNLIEKEKNAITETSSYQESSDQESENLDKFPVDINPIETVSITPH